MGSLETEDFTLTEVQKAHFLEHGFIKVPQCFTRSQAAEFTSGIWTRLGMSPTDKSTWTAERTNMPWHSKVPISEFSPKAWSAMCQLLGGEERISENPDFRGWSDGFIVNLGREGYEGRDELNLRCRCFVSLELLLSLLHFSLLISSKVKIESSRPRFRSVNSYNWNLGLAVAWNFCAVFYSETGILSLRGLNHLWSL